jgi:hypothetical protein
MRKKKKCDAKKKRVCPECICEPPTPVCEFPNCDFPECGFPEGVPFTPELEKEVVVRILLYYYY